MISDLCVAGRGPLMSTTLHALGKVNVICGRNNSGKSTLLSAVCADALTIGRRLSGDAIEPVFEIALRSNDVRQMAEHLHDRLREVVSLASSKHSDSVWFSNEGGA